MTSLFLTGASGFLGSAILRRLNPSDFRTITLLARSGVDLPAQLANSEKVKIINASLDDVNQYESSIDEQTTIVHLAAVTGKASPKDYFRINTEGTRKLVEASKKAGARNFLFISSIAVSFADRKGYFYADSKEQAENLIKESGLDYCIFRPTIILGKGSPIWNSFKKLASSSLIVLPGNGKIKIQPIYIDDMADLVLDVVTRSGFNSEILENGGPDSLTMDEFVRGIHHAMKKTYPRILHLPLALIVNSLRLFEKFFPSLLPVNSGQFSSFYNDGTAKENYLFKEHVTNMKTMDSMLELMLQTDSDQNTGNANRECAVFTRYLIGELPDKYVVDKYFQALKPENIPGEVLSHTMNSKFDRLLNSIAVLHPLSTRVTDIYSRFFYSDSSVRKKLVLLLAILETWGPTYARLDKLNTPQNIILVLLKLMLEGVISVVMLIIILPILLPLQLIMGKAEARAD